MTFGVFIMKMITCIWLTGLLMSINGCAGNTTTLDAIWGCVWGWLLNQIRCVLICLPSLGDVLPGRVAILQDVRWCSAHSSQEAWSSVETPQGSTSVTAVPTCQLLVWQSTRPSHFLTTQYHHWWDFYRQCDMRLLVGTAVSSRFLLFSSWWLCCSKIFWYVAMIYVQLDTHWIRNCTTSHSFLKLV